MTTHMDETTKVMVEAIHGMGDQIDEIGLVGRLMHANLVDYQNTTGMLIENYKKQISDLQATLGAIRTRINQLFAGQYMPTETAIIQAVFYPTKAMIEACREPEGEL